MAIDYAEIHKGYAEEMQAQFQRDRTGNLAVVPPFDVLTPEKLREAANEIRKRQGLPPLP